MKHGAHRDWPRGVLTFWRNWSLRLRVSLFFALIGAGGVAAILIGLSIGMDRLDPSAPEPAFKTAAAIAAAGLLALVGLVWLLFDIYVARPLSALAGALRASAHAGVALSYDAKSCRYLGDLAPAADAVAVGLARARTGLEDAVGEQTARLLAESELLGEALRDAPVGLVVCAEDDRVALYNREAAALLGEPERLGLGRSLAEALEAGPLRERLAEIRDCGGGTGVCGVCALNGRSLDARFRVLDLEGAARRGYALALFDPEAPASEEAAGADPADAYHDLTLLSAPSPEPTPDAPLNRLTFVVLDTETTGLTPEEGDEIVQIAAARIVKGRLLLRETFETLVDPGRSIPEASTRFHGITGAMVAGAPAIGEAGARLRRFCEGAVLVAHNARFDLAFLRKHRQAIGADFDMPVLDTLLLSEALFGETAIHSLDALARRFEVEIAEEDRHTARGDAIATAKILLRMIPVLEARGVLTLGAARKACEQRKAL